MQNKYSVSIIVMLLLLTFGAYSQKSNKDIEEEASYLFGNKEYLRAYDLFDKLYSKNPKVLDYKFKLGYCCLFYPEKKLRAIEIFEDIKRTTKSKDAEDIDYYLGKAYHINYRFDEAVRSFESFILQKGTKVKDDDKPLVDDANLAIKNSKSGKDLIDKKIKADISNIKGAVNSEESEYVPIITADESMLIFTYAGKKSMGGKVNDDLQPDPVEGYYHEDIYMSTRKPDSTWSDPLPIKSLNTKGHDAAIAISPDGQFLFTYTSSDKDKGDIYMSTLVGMEWSKPVRLNKNINTDAWEGSCSMSADGHFLYFASEKAGGLGGRDIWVSEKASGDWGPAINLGPTINTLYDEDAPFIHPDGITLFFSSKGHTSIGGYDIMFSVKKDNDWTEPRNMGIPLNTTEDDRYYVINAKGDKGFFSSDRGSTGGKGKQDIYMVEPGVLGEKPIVAILKGTIYGNDKPIEGKLEVYKVVAITQLSAAEQAELSNAGNTNDKGKILFGPYYSNSSTGKYLLALSPGSVYKIRASAVGFEPVEEEFDIEGLAKFLEVRKDIYLYSDKPSTSVVTGSTTSNTGGTTVNPTTTETPTSTVNVTTTETKTTQATTTETVATTNNPNNTNTTEPKNTPCDGGPAPDFTALKGKSLNDPAVYKQLLAIGGNYCAGTMIFKVQIAAYRHPENYKYDHLIQFGKPAIVDYPDGITRFTQLEFKTIKDAEVQRQKAIAKGQKDAWIVGFIDGKRYTLEELIMLDFLGKSIN